MKRHLLTSKIWLPWGGREVFALCSDMARFPELVPPWVHFRFLTPAPITLRLDTVIEYRVHLHGVPIRWRSRIIAWAPPHRFVDQQTRGPYRLWVHEHTFEPSGKGTLYLDRVEYAHPGGWPVHRLLVRPDLRRIWVYRLSRIAECCGTAGTGEPRWELNV